MKYSEIYAYNIAHNLCPFCSLPENFYLEKSEYFSVTYARAPYTKDHLLIIPNRHVVLFNSLSHEEVRNLMDLVSKWTEILHKEHTDIALLLRDWFIWGSWWKSVDHMHFHLIPDVEVWSIHWCWPSREYLSEKELLKHIAEVKKLEKKPVKLTAKK